MNKDDSGRVPKAAPGSREPSREGVSAASGFDPSRSDDAAYREAVALADSTWRRHYTHRAPDWKPLPDLRGVISQIDNMIAGLGSRLDEARWLFAQIAQMHSTDHGDIAERCMELGRKGYARLRDSDGSREAGETALAGSTRSATARAAESGIAQNTGEPQ